MGKANPLDEFTPSELRKLRSLKSPYGIQKYLDEMPYHLSDTGWSPRRVLKEETSHCFEGATLAAAALRANGYPALIFDLEAEHDTDHVVAIYKSNGHWGSIAKSNYTGCRYREPVYRTLRELAMSYFDTLFQSSARANPAPLLCTGELEALRSSSMDDYRRRALVLLRNICSTSDIFLLSQKRKPANFIAWMIGRSVQAAWIARRSKPRASHRETIRHRITYT